MITICKIIIILMKMIIFAIIQIRGHGNGALKAIHSSSADPPWFSIYAARPQNLLTLDNTQHQIYFRMICLDQPSEITAKIQRQQEVPWRMC